MAHIQKRAQGRYRVRYRDPSGNERSKTFTLKTDASRFQSAVEDELARGRWVDPVAGRIRFGDFAATVAARRDNVRPATRDRIASHLRVQILPAFGDACVCKIDRVSVQGWVDAIAKTLAPRTVRDSYRVFAGLMREAERRGLIRQSPCYAIVLPRIAAPEPRFLTADQVRRLADAIDDRYQALVYAGAYLGLRWSELAGLKRASLDLAGRRLLVVGALQRVGNGWRYSGQLKTARSRRNLSLPVFIAEVLAQQLRAGPESEFVFCSPRGNILHYRNFRRRFWDPAAARAGLIGITPHALRHTCVALMIAEGANPLIVQRQLGHADLRMTLGTYGHLFSDWDADVAERMHRLWLKTNAA